MIRKTPLRLSRPLGSPRFARVRFNFTDATANVATMSASAVALFAFANLNHLPLPPQRLQEIDLWPRHLGHKNLFGIALLYKQLSGESPSIRL